MKILFLTNTYPDFETSYRGIFVKKMATLLQKEGYQVLVVTPKIYYKSNYYENQKGIIAYRFPFFARNKLLIEHKRIPFIRMILYYISGFLVSMYVVKKHGCDLIHIHWAIPTGLIGVWVGTIIQKPILVTIHGSDMRMALKKEGILKRIFISVLRKSTHTHCVSEVQREELKNLGLPEEKISVFPMGIDEIFFNYKREHLSKIPSVTILSNRNLISIYNVSLLIQAIPIVLREVPEAKFIIAGEGSERGRLENEVNRLNLNSSVIFLGRIPHRDMPDLLAKSDIYVSTSLYDGTSVSLLEAMASGCFPVVSDIPSNREWIEEGKNGLLFPINDEKILAKKILYAIRSQELREKARELNTSIIKEKALWPVCIAKLKNIYEGIRISPPRLERVT